MDNALVSPSLSLLRNRIDFTKVPFSDRGSRLLVYLDPDHSQLSIKLAERLIKLEGDIEAYLRRPPFIRDLCFIDDNGEQLEYEVISYPHVIYFNTELGDFSLVFCDNQTLAFGMPPEITVGIRFHVSPQLWKASEKGGEFKSVRNLAYASNAETIHNQIESKAGGYTVDFIINTGEDSTIVINIEDELALKQEVQPFSKIYDEAESRWQDWFSLPPPVLETYSRSYSYAWWIMGNNLIKPKGTIAYEAMVPSKGSYVGLWLWDSAMHTLAYRHADPELARNQIRAILTCQLPDGMLPDAVYDEGIVVEIDHPINGKVTKPPILAWAALKLHEVDPQLEFLQEIYVPLVRWNAWWFSMNDDDSDGLAQYNHPYSSGLDDNPLWDYGMPVESPDLNTYLCVQMGSLAMMAELLGLDAEAGMWRRRAAAIVQRMIKDFWDDQAGIFRAMHYDQPISVVTPFNLFPLWSGQLPNDIRDRVLNHLTDPNQFWGDFVIPSVSRSDPHFEADVMWRGPIWANVNYFFVEALRQIGENQLADILTEKTLNIISKHSSIYEYYNAETGEPPARAADAFGWTAAIFIDLAISASKESQPEVDLDLN